MPSTEDTGKKKPKSDARLIRIASAKNPKLLMSALTYPQAASGPVTFDQLRTYTPLQPFSWWVLVPVDGERSVFQIQFMPSDGHLCLAASAETAGAPLQLNAIDPSNQLQLWQLDEDKTGAQLIINHGKPSVQMGYPHDIPLQNMTLQSSMVTDTYGGDKFIIQDVTF